MSNLRIFWIIWCSMWALGWLLIGFLTIVGWIGVPLSLLAILIPVGERTLTIPAQYPPLQLPPPPPPGTVWYGNQAVPVQQPPQEPPEYGNG